MNIDWKVVSQCEGYKSLKALYVGGVTEKHISRSRKEYLKTFHWVMNRAKHYAYVKGTTVDLILNKWESGRRGWWFGYYSDYTFPKLNRGSVLKPLGVNGYKKSLNSGRLRIKDPVKRKRAVFSFIQRTTKSRKVGRKRRWETRQKLAAKRVLARKLEKSV